MAELMGPILKDLRTTSCYPQIVNLNKDARLQSVINKKFDLKFNMK